MDSTRVMEGAVRNIGRGTDEGHAASLAAAPEWAVASRRSPVRACESPRLLVGSAPQLGVTHGRPIGTARRRGRLWASCPIARGGPGTRCPFAETCRRAGRQPAALWRCLAGEAATAA